jgi:C4-dicarboxylate-specific signal transduction histidine kinase
MTAQFTFLFLYLVYISDPSALKHVWLFTYSIILLYFQGSKRGFFWFTFLISMLLIAPFQGFIEVQYSFYQLFYISFVLVIINLIIRFYQIKMDEAKELIVKQQNKLLNFNAELERQVKEKTAELQTLNEMLEVKVEAKAVELMQKDRLITAQSKQAVMGEMINMIAHQWRQPLSTITLQIANYQFKQLLNKNQKEREVDKTLSEISNTIVYLSDTIDDFQTYFAPNKEKTEIEMHELLRRTLGFVLPRLKGSEIEVFIDLKEQVVINTYVNEIIQVLLNLLNNAIDSLLESNKKNSLITLSIEEKVDKILISVQDNASGIAPDNVTRIFEPYFSTKGKNGTGLGLYMSQMIVQKQFSGDITVETSPNGSTFIVEICKRLS